MSHSGREGLEKNWKTARDIHHHTVLCNTHAYYTTIVQYQPINFQRHLIIHHFFKLQAQKNGNLVFPTRLLVLYIWHYSYAFVRCFTKKHNDPPVELQNSILLPFFNTHYVYYRIWPRQLHITGDNQKQLPSTQTPQPKFDNSSTAQSICLPSFLCAHHARVNPAGLFLVGE